MDDVWQILSRAEVERSTEDLRRVEFLRRVFLFAAWPDDQLWKLAKVLQRKTFGANECIVREGTASGCLYFLYSGSVRVLLKRVEVPARQHARVARLTCFESMDSLRAPPSSARLPDSSATPATLELAELHAERYFGERALMAGGEYGGVGGPLGTTRVDDGPIDTRAHTASVVSNTPIELLVLSKHYFYQLFDEATRRLMTAYADKFYVDEPLSAASYTRSASGTMTSGGCSTRCSARATPGCGPSRTAAEASRPRPRGGITFSTPGSVAGDA